MDYQTRHIGMMLCGKYCVTDGRDEDCLYIACNMHWEPHDFALPKPFKNRRWRMLLNTAKEEDAYSDSGNQCVTLSGRSVRIYISEEIPKSSGKRAPKKK